MKHHYKIRLQSDKDIQDTIKALQAQKQRIETLSEVLRTKIAQRIRDESDSGFQKAVQHIWTFYKGKFEQTDELLDMPKISIRAGGTDSTIVIAESQDVLFIEFGTGVHHNATRPYEAEATRLKMLIGEYGDGNGKKDKWMFPDETVSKKWWWTHGMASTPAMSMAIDTVQSQLLTIASEVFGT